MQIKGNILNSGAMQIHNSQSILFAEALALQEGVKNALSLGIKNIQIEGDNLASINAVRKTWQIPWEIHNLVQNTCLNLNKFDYYSIQHVYREGNNAADYLANLGHNYRNMSFWYYPLDYNLSLIIRKNVCDWPSEKG